jgi:oxygen-independent coproporphyrinogen-3 oxidase
LTNPSDLKNYLGSLESEIDFFAPFFSGHPFFALYLGGGTPSVLSPFQLENLCNLINSKFSLEKNAEATIEMSPATVTRHKLEVASRGGFNRLSLGVQSMDRTVMEMNNRKYVGFDKMEKIFRDTKKANFEAFSADLIIGLTGDEMDKFLETLRFIIQMDPDEIVLYRLTCSPQEISIMDPIWRSKLIASLYPDCRGNRTSSDK